MTGVMWLRPLTLRAVVLPMLAFAFLLSGGIREANAQGLTEGFDVVNSNTAEPLPGWFARNNSSPPGSTIWFQGNGTDVFPSHQGGPDAYIAANFNSTGNLGDISTWLLTPQMTFNNGDVITFWTRTVEKSLYPDRLELRLSTAGASTNVGTTFTSVGDFTTRLLVINENLEMGGYPETWTMQSVTLSGLPGGSASGRIAFRYFVPNGGLTGANSNYIGVDTLSIGGSAVPAMHQESDFDGDGRTDAAVARNTGGGANGQVTWFIRQSSNGALTGAQWGIATDMLVPGDYDGDNHADIAVFRQSTGTWYIINSATGTVSTVPFGLSGDDPQQGDWDGDGHADPAVYRAGATAGQQSYFFYRGSLNNPGGNITYIPWGQNGDFGAAGDFDGDGRKDAMVQRNNGNGQARFFIRYATGATDSVVFGIPSDFIVPGDYDGDGHTDIAVARPVGGQWNWFVRPSSTGVIGAAPFAVFGNSGTDYLVQGDYNGDGMTDAAVFRPDTDPNNNFFFWQESGSGAFGAIEWGQDLDYPVANWNVH
jgi:hypothetical protein